MQLERDEFLVTFDPAKAGPDDLTAIIKQAGYTSYVVTGESQPKPAPAQPAASNDSLWTDALARAKREG